MCLVALYFKKRKKKEKKTVHLAVSFLLLKHSQQRHSAVRTNGQVWIDAQPRPAPEPGTPVKVLTVFKTCTDEDENEDHCALQAPAENVRSPRISRHTAALEPAARVGKQQPPRSRRSEQVEDVPTIAAARAEVQQVNPFNEATTPAATTTTTSATLTLDQLYSQCEQLADSFDREVEEQDGKHRQELDLSTDDQTSDDLSAALDVTSEQVSVSCDSWRRVRNHQAIQEESDDASSSADSKANDTGIQRGRTGGPMNGRGGDYSPEYIEVEEPDEPVPTQDSCLQVHKRSFL